MMGRVGGRRRAPRRLCLAAAALCALGSLAGPAGAGEDHTVAPPQVFRSTASAFVASVEADREALLPVEDLFRFIALDTTSTFETDLQTARASLLFPGNGLILGPNLACGTVGGQFPPEFAPVFDACAQYDYPLTVRADPSTPRGSTDGSITVGAPADPVSADLVTARARAEADGSDAYAAMNDLRVLGLPGVGPIPMPANPLELDSTVLTIRDARSHTKQTIERGVLTVRAESVLTGVSLVGGLIRIGSIDSRSVITDDGVGTRTADAALEVNGVTVGGVPAQITDQGIVVGDPSGGTGPIHQELQSALNELLAALGVRVTMLDAQRAVDDGHGQAVASVGGLFVEVAAGVEGLPTFPGPQGDLELNGTYVGSFQLGNSAAAGGAARFDEEIFAPVGIEPAGFDDAAFDNGAAATGPAIGAPTGSAPTIDDDGGDRAGRLVRRTVDNFGGRIGLLYLAFAFAVLGVCVAPRLIVPARLPAARS